MSTTSRWIVPCYFSEEKMRTTPIIFDLKHHFQTMLSNEIWKRKFHYGYGPSLENTRKEEIRKATITIYPRFFSGMVNEARIPELIEKKIGKLPDYLELNNYKEWPYRIGVAIIETVYTYDVKKIPTRRALKGDIIPHVDEEFIEIYHQHLAVLKEISTFFLASLHLSFPTSSVIMRNDDPLNDGFFQIASKRKTYATRVATNSYMHEILIETSKMENVNTNLEGLAKIWHYNLWPIKRFLNAVESDQLSMDNLLDLIYALEGLFEKNASADFIKTMCMIMLCQTQKNATSMKNLLDIAYHIRNNIAHGERSYDPFEYVKLEGKDTLAQKVYWKMKGIVAAMLIRAASKLLSQPDMRNMRFNADDLINTVFTKS